MFRLTSALMLCFVAGRAAGETHTVMAFSTTFEPATVQVAPGDTVTWHYVTGYPHTVTSGDPCTSDGIFDAPLNGSNPSFTWDVPADASGDITYFCQPHCAIGMTGVLQVVSEVCELTRDDIEGPYWLDGSPERSNLRDAGETPLLDLHIEVLDQDCGPIPGAWVDVWHADASGDYDKSGWSYRGHHYANDAGASLLETIVPGLYPGRTSHIHVKVSGVAPDVLTTQLYFPGFPENEWDAFYHPDLEVTLIKEDDDGNMVASFTFVIDDSNTCPADVDGDGGVGVDDLLAVIGAFGGPGPAGDATGDGWVDVEDVLVVIAGWGACP